MCKPMKEVEHIQWTEELLDMLLFDGSITNLRVFQPRGGP